MTPPAPKRPKIGTPRSLYLDDLTITRLDTIAQRLGLSRSGAVRALAKEGEHTNA